MAKFVYLGNHATTSVFGVDFAVGQPTEVTDERAVRKLRANPHFSEVFDGVEIVEPEAKRGPGRPRKVEQE